MMARFPNLIPKLNYIPTFTIHIGLLNGGAYILVICSNSPYEPLGSSAASDSTKNRSSLGRTDPRYFRFRSQIDTRETTKTPRTFSHFP